MTTNCCLLGSKENDEQRLEGKGRQAPNEDFLLASSETYYKRKALSLRFALCLKTKVSDPGL